MATADKRRVFDAPLAEQGPVPAYKVVELDGSFEKEVARFDEKSRTISRETVVVEGGYMVVFPRGHSIYVQTLEQLEEKGFGEVVPLIRMNFEAEVNKEHAPSTTKRVITKGQE